MTFKTGTTILRLSPQIVLALIQIEPIFKRFGHELVVTSIYRPDALLHGTGMAFDCRVREIPISLWSEIAQEAQLLLRPLGFDVILENPTNDPKSTIDSHIHVEYDPKDSKGNKLSPLT